MTEERKRFIQFVLFLAVIILAVFYWSVTSYDKTSLDQTYSRPFENRQIQNVKQRDTYRPSGLRESEIEKRQGRRYETY